MIFYELDVSEENGNIVLGQNKINEGPGCVEVEDATITISPEQAIYFGRYLQKLGKEILNKKAGCNNEQTK